MMEYSKIKKAIESAPATWLPALLKIIVLTSYEKKIWRKNDSCSTFVKLTEEEIKEKGE
jgi:hypothetical protein